PASRRSALRPDARAAVAIRDRRADGARLRRSGARQLRRVARLQLDGVRTAPPTGAQPEPARPAGARGESDRDGVVRFVRAARRAAAGRLGLARLDSAHAASRRLALGADSPLSRARHDRPEASDVARGRLLGSAQRPRALVGLPRLDRLLPALPRAPRSNPAPRARVLEAARQLP